MRVLQRTPPRGPVVGIVPAADFGQRIQDSRAGQSQAFRWFEAGGDLELHTDPPQIAAIGVDQVAQNRDQVTAPAARSLAQLFPFRRFHRGVERPARRP